MKLQKQGVRRKLTLIYEVTIVVMLVLSLTINTILTDQEKTKTRNALEDNILMTAKTVDSELNYIGTQLQSLSFNSKMCLFDAFYNQRIGTDGWLESMKSFQWYFRSVCQSSDMILDMYLIMRTHQRVIGAVTLNKYISETEKTILTNLQSGTYCFIDGRLYLGCMLQYKGCNGNSAVVATFSPQTMLNRLVPVNVPESCAARLYFGNEIAAEIGCGSWENETDQLNKWVRSGDRWYYRTEVSSVCDVLGNHMIASISISDYSIHGNNYIRYFAWMGIQAFLSFVMLYIYRKFERNHIEQPLVDMLEEYENTVKFSCDTEALPAMAHGQELEYVSLLFRSLMEHYRESLEKEYRLKMDARYAEIRYLQKQLDPHFLYNCFYNIYRLCRNEGCDRAANFSLKLSEYYSYITADAERDLVCLDDEFKHAIKYLEIQKERFRNRLEICVLPLEEGYGRLMVPKLILQPIFENIIKHIVEKDSAVQIVTIRIHCMKSDGRLEICVEDNGTALPEDRLQSIRENLEHGQTSGTGLINVKRRM